MPESFAGGRDRLFEPQHPQQEILDRQQRQEDAITYISGAGHDGRHERVHPIMVRGRDDGDQDHTRITEPNEAVDAFPKRGLLRLARFQFRSEDAGVVDHGAADDEGVAEMHARHGGEGVDEVAAHPDGGRFVVADGVEEAVFRGQQARRHAGVEGEG